MKLAYKKSGTGEPMAILHSGLETSSTDFIYQQSFFSELYTVIAFDLRGHGNSIATEFSNFFEDSSRDLYESLLELGIKKVHLLGASLGALVALYFTKNYPHFVESLVVSGITPIKPDNWSDLHLEQKTKQVLLLEDRATVNYFDSIHYSNWRELLALAQNEDWYPFEQTSNIEKINCPILIISGDKLPSERASFSYYQGVEHVEVKILPDSGHLVHVEQPELYSNTVYQFLKNSN